MTIPNNKQSSKGSKPRQMVRVAIFYDGTYIVDDIDSNYATQKLYGWFNGQSCIMYHCLKDKQKLYLKRGVKEISKQCDKDLMALVERKASILQSAKILGVKL